MKINLCPSAGFCFGVNRAVDFVYEMLDKGEKVCTLGPIIHNPQVIDDLKKRGVEIINDPLEAPKNTTVVIRTHGVTKDTLEALEKNEIPYKNLTCPFVMKIHKIVEENSLPGTVTLIAGDPNHPEVQGFRSRCKGESFVYGNAEELKNILENHPDIRAKTSVCVAQTTFSIKEWEKCLKILNLYLLNQNIFATICKATDLRQNEAVETAKKSDAMIVVGGRSSSNTNKLKAVCEEYCPTYLIENAEELKDIPLSDFNNIGVTAGASTPAGIIKEVLFTMSEIINEQTETNENFEELMEENLNSLKGGKVVTGEVVGITPNEIQVDIGGKHTGIISIDEYSDDPAADPTKELKIGDTITAIHIKTLDDDGICYLSKRKYDQKAVWSNFAADYDKDTVYEAVINSVVKGGVTTYVKGLRVFIPASLTGLAKDEDLSALQGTTQKFKIIEFDAEKRKVIGSIREVLRDERRAKREEFWQNIAEGQVYTGKVKSMTSYGAFINLDNTGIDGMVHISELSWGRIKSPADVLSIGDEIEVFVKAVDVENKKISLGYKKAEDNPWEILRRDYPVGSVVTAKIVGMTTFGAFANVIPGIDGLIHISQIADRRIEKPQDVLSIGEEVQVKITEIDFDKRRVSLSIRALLDDQAKVEAPEEEEAEEEIDDALEATVYSTDDVHEEVAEEAAKEVAEEATEDAPAEEAAAEETVEEAPAEEPAAEEAAEETAEEAAEEAPAEEADDTTEE